MENKTKLKYQASLKNFNKKSSGEANDATNSEQNIYKVICLFIFLRLKILMLCNLNIFL